MDKNLLQRIISGLIYGLVVFFCTTPTGSELLNKISPVQIRQEFLFYGLMTFFMLVAVYECMKILKFENSIWKWLVLPLGGFVYYRYSIKYFHQYFFYQFNLPDILTIVLILLACITVFKFAQELYFENGKMIFTVIYAVLPFCFSLALPRFIPHINSTFSIEVFLIFILIWSSDSFAYFTGRLFGKHKMAPKISPKKTWEGFAGGVLCTVIFGFVIEYFYPELRGNWAVIGFLISVFAPIGDLVESQLKRTFGVKDSGNIIPGHGGVLDRLDSFIICVPVLYLYFLIDNLI